MVSNIVLDALRQALEANPDDLDLKLHLAELLIRNEENREALEICQSVLATQPVHKQALQVALAAAEAFEDSTLVDGYQQLLASLHQEASEGFNPKTLKELQTKVKLRLVKSDSSKLKGLDGKLAVSPCDLEQVVGMDKVKQRLILSILTPLKHPDISQAYAKTLSGSLLLYGPPGCGKSFIANALAGELAGKFLAINFTDIVDMYLGETEKKLHDIFYYAKTNAPMVLFLDEFDAIAQKRSDLRQSSLRSLVSQLFTELDMIHYDNNQVFVLASSNQPWDIDPAFLRPGRLDRLVAVLPPDDKGRKAIFQYYLKSRPIADDLNLDYLVKQTEDFSGADIAYLCEATVEYVLAKSIQSDEVHALQTQDFLVALQEVQPSISSWLETIKNDALFSNPGGLYDELHAYLHKKKLY